MLLGSLAQANATSFEETCEEHIKVSEAHPSLVNGILREQCLALRTAPNERALLKITATNFLDRHTYVPVNNGTRSKNIPTTDIRTDDSMWCYYSVGYSYCMASVKYSCDVGFTKVRLIFDQTDKYVKSIYAQEKTNCVAQ